MPRKKFGWDTKKVSLLISKEQMIDVYYVIQFHNKV